MDSSPIISPVQEAKWCREFLYDGANSTPAEHNQEFADPALFEVFNQQNIRRSRQPSLSGDHIEVSSLRLFVAVPEICCISCKSPEDIVEGLKQFSKQVVAPMRVFVFLGTTGSYPYLTNSSVPLYQGLRFNKALIDRIQKQELDTIVIIEDVASVGRGCRVILNPLSLDTQRITFRADVSFEYPGTFTTSNMSILVGNNPNWIDLSKTKDILKYLSVRQFSHSVIPTSEALDKVRETACKALTFHNCDKEHPNKCSLATMFLTLEGDGVEFEVVVLGLSSLEVLGVEPKKEEICAHVMELIDRNLDESHSPLLSCASVETLREVVRALINYVRQEFSPETPKIILKQERAIVVLADSIWEMHKRKAELVDSDVNVDEMISVISSVPKYQESLQNSIQKLKTLDPPKDELEEIMQYAEFLEVFLKCSNERELRDFDRCGADLLAKIGVRAEGYEMKQSFKAHRSESGMRVGISSANASDNWTNSKLSGGMVVNVAINFTELGKCPVECILQRIDTPQIILETTHTMSGPLKTDTLVFGEDDVENFLDISDAEDPYRMLKYAFVFTGILRKDSVWDDLKRFTRGGGIRLALANLGPSRSGFASSSAVALNLLQVLYGAAGVISIARNPVLLGSMALLFENRLGLKSGRQDVDGLLPGGVKSIDYVPQNGFQVPVLSKRSPPDLSQLPKHMRLINSGIPRAAGLGLHRGLNMRFWAYLSRNVTRYACIVKSYGAHRLIVKAIRNRNWALLGRLFLEYMGLREKIDPGATQSIHDADMNGQRVLRLLFDPLVEEGLIHGGMFTGGMGGGVAMLVLTDKGKTMDADSGMCLFDLALEKLKTLKTDKGNRPYSFLQEIKYDVNMAGLKYWTTMEKYDAERVKG